MSIDIRTRRSDRCEIWSYVETLRNLGGLNLIRGGFCALLYKNKQFPVATPYTLLQHLATFSIGCIDGYDLHEGFLIFEAGVFSSRLEALAVRHAGRPVQRKLLSLPHVCSFL